MTTLSRFIWMFLPFVILAIFAVYVPVKLFDDKGYRRVEEIDRDLQSLKSQNRKIKRENESLKSQIRAMHSDPDYIENIARNEMGMIAPGEIVYQF